MSTPTLVLASSSPRRRELLGRLTDAFEVRVPEDVDETPHEGEDPLDYVQRIASAKGLAAAAADTVTIAADTIVVLDDEILGKPRDRADAADMLRRLSGRTHQAITAVWVSADRGDDDVRRALAVERTEVRFADLTEDRIAAYLATGEADDKAGSYGLQGAAAVFADDVRGSVTNVIGLPLPLLDRLCREVGVDLLAWRT
ncbi:MAG: Maf family protein [Acidimicrobiales bacterium]|nr:Maf family protein [Acidimicrobiales bacterium]